MGQQRLSPLLIHLLVVLSQPHSNPLPHSHSLSSNLGSLCEGGPGEDWVTNAIRPPPAQAGKNIGTFFSDKQQ